MKNTYLEKSGNRICLILVLLMSMMFITEAVGLYFQPYGGWIILDALVGGFGFIFCMIMLFIKTRGSK